MLLVKPVLDVHATACVTLSRTLDSLPLINVAAISCQMTTPANFITHSPRSMSNPLAQCSRSARTRFSSVMDAKCRELALWLCELVTPDQVHQKRFSMKSESGFTLIELMVVTVIVGVLAAIAIPSYQQHVIKSKRAAAESFMLQASNREEQIMLDLRGYVAVTANANFPNAPTTAPQGLNISVPDNVSNFYNITVESPAPATPAIATSYLVKATPINSQLTADTKCATPTLDQTGLKSKIGGTGSIAECW